MRVEIIEFGGEESYSVLQDLIFSDKILDFPFHDLVFFLPKLHDTFIEFVGGLPFVFGDFGVGDDGLLNLLFILPCLIKVPFFIQQILLV